MRRRPTLPPGATEVPVMPPELVDEPPVTTDFVGDKEVWRRWWNARHAWRLATFGRDDLDDGWGDWLADSSAFYTRRRELNGEEPVRRRGPQHGHRSWSS